MSTSDIRVWMAVMLCVIASHVYAKGPCDDIANAQQKQQCLKHEQQKAQQQAQQQAKLKAQQEAQRQAQLRAQQEQQRQQQAAAQKKAQEDAKRQQQAVQQKEQQKIQQQAQQQTQLKAQQEAQRQAQLKAQQEQQRQQQAAAQKKAQEDAKRQQQQAAQQKAPQKTPQPAQQPAQLKAQQEAQRQQAQLKAQQEQQRQQQAATQKKTQEEAKRQQQQAAQQQAPQKTPQPVQQPAQLKAQQEAQRQAQLKAQQDAQQLKQLAVQQKAQPPATAKSSISGKLHKNSASGAPLDGVSVTSGGKSDTTGKDGKFKLDGVAAGNATIALSRSGYDPYQGSVNVVAGKNADMGDRWLTEKAASAPTQPPPTTKGSISGKLHKNSASGPTLDGVAVAAGGKSATTGKDGIFKLDGIAAGNATIAFSKSGYESYQGGVSIAAGKNADMGARWLTEKAVLVPAQSPATTLVAAKDCKARGSDKKVGNALVCTPQCVDYVKCVTGISRSGNAGTWLDGKTSGYSVEFNGRSKNLPRSGDVLVNTKIGGTGHVAYVESISGNTISISETNFNSKLDCGYRNDRKISLSKDKDGKYSVASFDGWLRKA